MNGLNAGSRFAVWLALLAIAALTAAAPAAAGERVRIAGTGAALGTMEMLAAELRRRDPAFDYQIVPNLGSSGSLKALALDAVQIAIASRALKPEETRADFRALEYGKTPFVVITAKRGVSRLRVEQLAAFYANGDARWPDGEPVRLVLRPASDIDTDLLAGVSPHMKVALAAAMVREGMIVAATDSESATAVERLPGAIGTSTLALLLSEKRALKPVALNGVAPSIASLRDGSYPHHKTMTLVTRAEPNPMTARFLDFLASADGQRILVETGHLLPGDPAGATTQ